MRKLSSGKRRPFHTNGWNNSITSAIGTAGAPVNATDHMPAFFAMNV